MIKFGPSVVFMAAAHSGDTEEVRRLVLSEGANINSANKDGLTSLHQVLYECSGVVMAAFHSGDLYLPLLKFGPCVVFMAA